MKIIKNVKITVNVCKYCINTSPVHLASPVPNIANKITVTTKQNPAAKISMVSDSYSLGVPRILGV